MDARNQNHLPPTPLLQPFKFQTPRHQHPLLNQKPPPYHPNQTYQQDQQQLNYHLSGYHQSTSHENNNQLNVSNLLHLQQQKQMYQQSLQSCEVASKNLSSNVSSCRQTDQLLAKPAIRPIRHDFWARR